MLHAPRGPFRFHHNWCEIEKRVGGQRSRDRDARNARSAHWVGLIKVILIGTAKQIPIAGVAALGVRLVRIRLVIEVHGIGCTRGANAEICKENEDCERDERDRGWREWRE